MSTQTDFHYSLDRAANAVQDATCATRTAGALPLPAPHRRRLNSAIRKLTGAQDDLFKLRHDPWSTPTPVHAQLELL